jgi:NAD(P)-dependent dehydrogenase (short-subunit alcohol dehydrogenase family)
MKILITGGANGLGLEITKLLAKNNENVVYFTFTNSEASAIELQKMYNNTFGIKCDFTNSDDVAQLIQKISDFKINVLINNAYVGQAINKHIHKTAGQEFLNSFAVNITPVIDITNAAIVNFRKNGGGKIVSILTSFLDTTPPIGTSVYLTNKAIILQLSKCWNSENVKFNISANCISPSFMLTDFTKNTDDRIIEELINNHPLKKLLEPIEVAKVVESIITSTPHLSNQNIVINAS